MLYQALIETTKDLSLQLEAGDTWKESYFPNSVSFSNMETVRFCLDNDTKSDSAYNAARVTKMIKDYCDADMLYKDNYHQWATEVNQTSDTQHTWLRKQNSSFAECLMTAMKSSTANIGV